VQNEEGRAVLAVLIVKEIHTNVVRRKRRVLPTNETHLPGRTQLSL
jgi:hypothetical protein